MKIILQKPVGNLGAPGEVVEVKDGYARNYLFPRGLAVAAEKGTVRHAQSLQSAEARRTSAHRGEAEELASKLDGLQITFAERAAEDGKLFGSVTQAEISDEIERIGGGVVIDRKTVHIDEPIKTVGSHVVQIRLHPDVTVDLTVEVTAAE